MTVQGVLYIFAFWAGIYSIFLLCLLVYITFRPKYVIVVMPLILVMSSFLYMGLQRILLDGFNRVAVWACFHVPAFGLYVVGRTLYWFFRWLDSDPIVGGVNIRKSTDRRR